ncbi:hypothetical protein F4779DRAFT_77326 [Xylariaceae sp. FL0662B]|nr:hypothetical protein F4779DRAFT_77326 [Xylariaceae sp. FL0662B]
MEDIGPLTTTFVPSPGCNVEIYGSVFTQTAGDNTTTHKYHSLGLKSTSECYPPGFQPTSAFYSPGLCPSDWYSACGSLEVIGSVTETRAICCPLGYSCISPPALTETWSTLSCSSTAISVINVTVPDLSNQNSMVTQLESPLIHAAAIEVRWQPGDFATKTGSSLLTSATTSSSSGTASMEGVNTTTTTAREGLSVGARAGIGVGAGLAGLLLASALGFWILRRRPRASQDAANTKARETGTADWEPSAQETAMAVGVQEMQVPNYKRELFTSSNTHEFPEDSRPAELESRPLPLTRKGK